MDTPDLKLLQQLAKTCRKAGISSYEGFGFKFTLGDVTPATRKRPVAKNLDKRDLGENTVESDELSPEALMFWSSTGEPEKSEGIQ